VAAVQRVAVFCGASSGRRPAFADAAGRVAVTLAERGLGVVYGGGRVGLMGVVADAALAAGGDVIGVIPQHLVDREVAHPGVDDLRVVDSMHERKALMAELADGFVALPGGFGTLDELVEVVTWSQLGLHGKPCGVLNVDGYFDDLLAWVRLAAEEGFVREHDLLVVREQPGEIVDALVHAAARTRERAAPPP
jgi:uncharacterized protein (TIGR00730 family)